jgi:hypothetical protein
MNILFNYQFLSYKKAVNVHSKDHILMLLGLRNIVYYKNRTKRINTLCDKVKIPLKLDCITEDKYL